MKHRTHQVLRTISICCVAVSAHAAAGFDSMTFKPATDQGAYLSIEQSATLGQWGHTLGVTGDYSTQSVVLKNGAGARIQNAVERQLALDVAGAIGITDWLNVGAGFGGVPYRRFVTPATGVRNNDAQFGDVRVDLKAKLVDTADWPIGLAIVPFITVPTGSSDTMTSAGAVSGGAKVVMDTKRIADRVSFAVNLGGEVRKNATLTPGATRITDQFLYGAAMNWAIAQPVQLIAEIRGKTPFANFLRNRDSQLEVDGAVRFAIGEAHPVQITAGAGTGLQRGTGGPNIRAFTMLSYRFPVKAYTPMAVAPEEVISTNKIHFGFNKATIRPESHAVIDNIVSDIQGRQAITHVNVVGHTDSVGSDTYNMSLSEQRAASVRTYLINKNYPAEKVSSTGRGESEPVADNSTTAGRAMNRRVDFRLQKQAGSKVRVEHDQQSSPTFEDGDSTRNNRRSANTSI